MAQAKTTMQEMKNADVRQISLVRRAANRIPIRITKSEKEEPMIDLSNLRHVFKGEKKPEAPTIAGVVFDAEPGEATTAKLAELGLGDLSTVQKNEDGTVMLSKEVPAEGQFKLVRLSEEVCLVVKGMQLWSSGLDSSKDFNEVLAACSFYSGVSTATDALGTTVRNACYASEDQAAAETAISDAVQKFETYVTTLVKAVPSVAWKLEKEIGEAIKADKSKSKASAKDPDGDGDDDQADYIAGGGTKADWDAMSKDDKTKWSKANAAKKAKKSEGEQTDAPGTADTSATQAAAGTEAQTEGANTAAAGATDTGAAEGAAPAAGAPVQADPAVAPQAEAHAGLLASIESSIAKAIAPIKEGLETLTQKHGELEGQVKQVASKADNAASAVKSAVVAGATPGDAPAAEEGAQEAVRKSEADTDRFWNGFDSAFHKR
jgi:hypothetical protein